MKFLKCLIFFSFTFLGGELFAQKDIPKFSASSFRVVNDSALKRKFSSYRTISLSTKELNKYINGKNSFVLQLEVDDHLQFRLDLQPSYIVSPAYQLKLLTPGGIKSVESHPHFLFKGNIHGTKQQVRLAIKDGFINGFIETSDGEYFIEPLKQYERTAKKDEFILYKSSEVIEATLSCGTEDAPATHPELKVQSGFREDGTEDLTCKKIKFISAIDYSIFQEFDGDISAIEETFLANLNNAQGAYTSFNFDPSSNSDVGTDFFQFEMTQLIISTCQTCDIINKSEYSLDIFGQLQKWINANFPSAGFQIYQLWTKRYFTNGINSGLSGLSAIGGNCTAIRHQLLRYSNNAAFMRTLTAHETGHSFGCYHDNEMKSDVTSFLMCSFAGVDNTKFSTLADFKGVNYSSQLAIKNNVALIKDCLPQCNNCEEVKNVAVKYYNTPDSVTFSWNNAGKVKVSFKLKDSALYADSNSKLVNGNSITIKGLSACKRYSFKVQKECSAGNYGPAVNLDFSPSFIKILAASPLHFRGDKYDLELETSGQNTASINYFVFVDHNLMLSLKFPLPTLLNIPNLFADGARHRVDIRRDTIAFENCLATAFYTAPYYRIKSKEILAADFNDCLMPVGWKDTILRKTYASSANPKAFPVGFYNPPSSSVAQGNIDSTCMAYYFNFTSTQVNGAVGLFSPKVDITGYANVYLHFDYFFFGFKSRSSPTFTLDLFDGTTWETVFKRTGDSLFSTIKYKTRFVWDTLPPRVFINLEAYKNKDFQLRFVTDDMSYREGNSTYTNAVLTAVDNIRIDGFLKDSTSENDFIVFPNPTSDDVFIQFMYPHTDPLFYELFDATGRMIKKGIVNDYRISLKQFSSGIYFLRLNGNNKKMKTTKLVRL